MVLKIGPQDPQGVEFAGTIFQAPRFAQGSRWFQGPLAPRHAVEDVQQHAEDGDEYCKVPVHG